MTRTHAPAISVLGERECKKTLRRNHVGRMAFALHSQVDIEPLSYVFLGDWLFGRTSPGKKQQMLAHQPWVAFEVDEVEGPFDWRSVVVHGTYYELHGEGSPVEKKTFRRALAALRKQMPATLTKNDPVPHRFLLFGIHIDQMAGRAASSGKRVGPRGSRGTGRVGRSPTSAVGG